MHSYRMKGLLALLFSFALMLPLYAVANASSNAKNSMSKTAATKTDTKTPAKSSTAENTPAKHTAKSTAHTHALASAEDLSGTITAIGRSGKEVTLIGSNGIPYDFDLTRQTRLELSNQKAALSQLSGETNKQATVHFVPTSRGNVAKSIQITAS
ncbi:MAG TPA: hypothetical protein VMD99_01990 [Terriglobales bacterium]|nr:hypothetical protein [Terriglobales bacterium]